MDFGWQFHLGDAPDAGNNLIIPKSKIWPRRACDEIGQEGNLATMLPTRRQKIWAANISFVQNNFDDSQWRQLDLPHDWAVELPFDEKCAT